MFGLGLPKSKIAKESSNQDQMEQRSREETVI